ncbi:MAG: hypothetical protein IT280_11985 [Ignavibacteria bacterium]|nr:hypothetical protein [Ignavibacteria bacterium]
MKIDFTIPKNTILTEGIHTVKVTGITIGTNLKTGNKFFKCVFSNKEGFLPQWFYITDGSKPFLRKLFNACGIYDDIAEVKDLLNKELKIQVVYKNLINPVTGEITKEISSCVNFEFLNNFN